MKFARADVLEALKQKAGEISGEISSLERCLVTSPRRSITSIHPASENYETEGIILAQFDSLNTQLWEVNNKISMMTVEKYDGIHCLQCSQEIDPDRLKEIPQTFYCFSCKSASEVVSLKSSKTIVYWEELSNQISETLALIFSKLRKIKLNPDSNIRVEILAQKSFQSIERRNKKGLIFWLEEWKKFLWEICKRIKGLLVNTYQELKSYVRRISMLQKKLQRVTV